MNIKTGTRDKDWIKEKLLKKKKNISNIDIYSERKYIKQKI